MSLQVKCVVIDNPEARSFVIGQKISTRAVEYLTQADSQLSPIARKIFGFPWAEKVKVGTNFIEVQKQSWVDWDILEEPLTGLIQEHFESEFKKLGPGALLEENREPAIATTSNDPRFLAVEKLIENEINPSVAGHGGKVVLLDVKGDKAFVRLEGGCQGCSQSAATLKQGIEVRVKEVFPDINEVLDITDHAMGSNPYFIEA